MTQKRWVLISAVLGSAIVFLDSTVINVALPRIGHDLPRIWVSAYEGQSYVYSGYLLTLSALLVLAGALSDFYGRRRLLQIGVAAFGIASVLCGLAPNMELLILFRLIQGAAGAVLVPGSLALLTANFRGEEQGRAFGIWAGATSGVTIVGPLLGGLLVDTYTWRLVFLINVPVVLLTLYASQHTPESRDETATGDFDWLGAAAVALAVGGLAFGAIYGEQRQWRDPLAFIALGLGALTTAGLPWLMAHSPHPLVPLSLFASRNFTVINIATLLIYGALYVIGLNQGLFQQGTLGYTAAAAGLAGVPGFLFLVFFSSRVGALAGRIGPRTFLIAGPVVMAAGTLWLTRIPPTSAAWLLDLRDPASWVPPGSYFTDILPANLVFGIGITILVAPLTTALMGSVPVHNAALASSINNAISRIGPQLAGAVIFIAITASFYTGMAARVPGLDVNATSVRQQLSPLNRPDPHAPAAQAAAARGASTDAFHLAMLIGAGLLLLGSATSAAGIRVRLPPGAEAQEPSAQAAIA